MRVATTLGKWFGASAVLMTAASHLNQLARAQEPEFQRTTADVVPVADIQVENGTPNAFRLQLPSTVDPPTSATPLFIPAGDPNAHIFATMILPETIFDPAGTPTGKEVAWWDVVIKVTTPTTAPLNEDVMISIDKDVFNETRFHWTDFHMELGYDLGANFQQSGEFDFLFFKDEPPPISTDGKFMDPPSKDDAAAADVIWWDWNPPADPGAAPGELARFWLGINVPRSLFVDGMATFTLRQHATRIPEPGAMSLCSLGLAAWALSVRRRRMRTSPRI